jgi:hypothetical protein
MKTSSMAYNRTSPKSGAGFTSALALIPNIHYYHPYYGEKMIYYHQLVEED